MNKKGNVSLTMVLFALCTALVLCTAGMGGATEAQAAGGIFDGCGLYQTFQDINESWREGLITNRELVLAKVKAFYEESSGVDPTCSGEVLDYLKQEVLEDVYRLSDELSQSDKLILDSLSADLAEALERAPASSEQAQQGASVGTQTTFGRIAKALDEGTIGLKESVLLRAKLLYAPSLVPPQSGFAPKPGEAMGQGSRTNFFTDALRVKDLLNNNEKALLKSLSPNLTVILTSPAALPPYSQLTLTLAGKHNVVHYTLTGPDAVPNTKPPYASMVASYVDAAISAETKNFLAAIPEGPSGPNPGGMVQVYCLGSTNKDLMGAWGVWVPASVVPGNSQQNSGYILISSALTSGQLQPVVYHEYFHGIQAAYNAYMDAWFKEGTANWAEGVYCGSAACWKDVAAFYIGPDSIFKKPNNNLWIVDGDREYSTSALAFFLGGKYGGYKFILADFQNSPSQNDAVLNLQATLARQSGAPAFVDVYEQFLIALYNKDISSIKSYMPEVTLQMIYDDYGQTDQNTGVYLLGAEFYQLKPPDAPKNQGPFIAWLTPAGSVGSPVGILAGKGSQAPSNTTTAPPNPEPTSYLPNAKQEAVYIATDVTYTNKSDTAQRPYLATLITPYVKITDVTMTPSSPVQSGTPVNINANYTLLGTLQGQQFGVQVTTNQTYNGKSSTTGGPYSLLYGYQESAFPFTPGAAGTYNLTLQMSVPQDSWDIDQVTSTSQKLTLVATSASTPPSVNPQTSSCGVPGTAGCYSSACCPGGSFYGQCSNEYGLSFTGYVCGDPGATVTYGVTPSNFQSLTTFPQAQCGWDAGSGGTTCVRGTGQPACVNISFTGTALGDPLCDTDTMNVWVEVKNPSGQSSGQVFMYPACCTSGVCATCP
jgi:hypothetical protein